MPVVVARREDTPFIKCQVCEKKPREIHILLWKKEALVSPKKVLEFQIIKIAENVCNLKEADWILLIDMVEKGDKLEVMGYSGTEVAEFLFKSKPSVDVLIGFLCNDLSKACFVKPPPIPKDSLPDELLLPSHPKKDGHKKYIKQIILQGISETKAAVKK